MKLRALFATACAGLLVAPMAFAEVSSKIGLSGDVETNTTWEYKSIDRGAGGSDDLATNSWSNDGRTHLKLTGRVDSDSGWFALAQGDAMIATSGTTGVDDAWVQFGTSSFATKVGRYELEELMSKGEDVYIAEAPTAPHSQGCFPDSGIYRMPARASRSPCRYRQKFCRSCPCRPRPRSCCP